MTWKPPARSPVAAALYRAAEEDRAEHPERYRFDPTAVIERAAKRSAGTSDFFADGWQTGLAAFLRSAEQDARLNAVGIRMALQTAVGRLAAGAEIARYRDEHADVRDLVLAPPIVIVGGWRTGTTFLFRLLGSDPRLHAPLPAELAAPWLFGAGRTPPAAETTAAATELLHALNPEMAVVHPSGPALPEECVLAMGTDLRNWGFTSMMRLPSYADWLAGQDFTGPYVRYREVLQLLSSADGRRFVLKAPAHTAELDHLVDVFPGAVVVQIHRDIVETLTSGASLFAVYRSTYSDEVDPIEVGRQQVDQSELWLRRAADFRSRCPRADVTFVDLDYAALVADPAGCLKVIYRSAGLEPPADLGDAVSAYHAAHPRVGGHRYSADDFGLDPDDLRERFSFPASG